MTDPTAGPSELVHLHIVDGIATITLDSLHNRNALSAKLRADLSAHLETALCDEAVRVLVLTHTGPVFCAGADLVEARSGDVTSAGSELVAILEKLMTCEKPVVARLAGPARAGGIGLVAACDFTVAADNATFGFAEVRIGVIPSIISVPLRIRVLPHALHRLFLTGETFDAPSAATIGLLDEVTTSSELDDAVGRLTDTLLLGSPRALAGVKTVLRETNTLSTEFGRMLEVSARFFASPDAQEGMAAFAAKRRPAWDPRAAD